MRRISVAAAVVIAFALSVPMPGVAKTDREIKQELISNSIARYPGRCPCPYNTDRAGRSCGSRSAYARPGGCVWPRALAHLWPSNLAHPQSVAEARSRKKKGIVAVGKWKTWVSVFHFSIRSSELWECGKRAAFSKDGGKGGKAGLAFSTLSTGRHFHSSQGVAVRGFCRFSAVRRKR